MWEKQVLLAVLGFSAGAGIAAGLFSMIVGLGIISDLADRTHTGRYVTFYEDCLVLGGILGNLCWIYGWNLRTMIWMLPVYGLFSGIFVGCWSMALAEALNIFPVLFRRLKITRGIPYIILAMGIGRGIGSLIYFWNRW